MTAALLTITITFLIIAVIAGNIIAQEGW